MPFSTLMIADPLSVSTRPQVALRASRYVTLSGGDFAWISASCHHHGAGVVSSDPVVRIRSSTAGRSGASMRCGVSRR